nr:DUF1345 domain-containing protein [Propionibacterium sp.]
MNLHTAGIRLAASAVTGGVVAASLAAVVSPWLAGVAGWIVLASTFSMWTWLVVRGLDAADTRGHATREDPTHAVSRVVLVLASLASLVGVGVILLFSSSSKGSVPWEALTGVASVAASWVLVHVLYMLHYARLYYSDGTGEAIDFNGEGDPDYHDFAYLAFTLGMTYQVSDTALTGSDVRRVALAHALLSYLLGAVILAVTINLVVQLASGGA